MLRLFSRSQKVFSHDLEVIGAAAVGPSRGTGGPLDILINGEHIKQSKEKTRVELYTKAGKWELVFVETGMRSL